MQTFDGFRWYVYTELQATSRTAKREWLMGHILDYWLWSKRVDTSELLHLLVVQRKVIQHLCVLKELFWFFHGDTAPCLSRSSSYAIPYPCPCSRMEHTCQMNWSWDVQWTVLVSSPIISWQKVSYGAGRCTKFDCCADQSSRWVLFRGQIWLGIRNLKGNDSACVSHQRRSRLNKGAPVRSIGTGSCTFAALKEDGSLVAR